MPEIGRIQSTNFQSLLTELGITRNNIPFALRSEVTPVVLVGGTVSFVAAATPPYKITEIFSAGQLNAPAANTVMADTGQLPIGAYTVIMTVVGAVVDFWEFQWRNAANAANLVIHAFAVPQDTPFTFEVRLDIQTPNERFRVVKPGAGVGLYQATLFAKI